MIVLVLSTIVEIAILAYFLIHIKKINAELDEIAEEQSRQNEDIRNLMIAHYQLVQTLKDAAWIQEGQSRNYKA